jgi:hypothetical protein
MPLNVMDAHYDSFEKNVLPVLVKSDTGVLGMKPMGDQYHPRKQNGDSHGMPALRDEPSDQRGDHRLRFHADTRAGAAGGAEFPANEVGRNRGPSRQDRSSRAARQIRALQDDSHVRRTYQNPEWLG